MFYTAGYTDCLHACILVMAYLTFSIFYQVNRDLGCIADVGASLPIK